MIAIILAIGCSPTKRPPPFRYDPGSLLEAGTDGGGLVLPDGSPPPSADAPGLCGNQIIPVILDRPNLYFVLDRSTSMAEPLGSHNKYTTALLAIEDVLMAIGHRINYGAAVFPMFGAGDQCTAGDQVLETAKGDPFGTSPTQQGTTLFNFFSVLGARAPSGGTPMSATLTQITPLLRGLPGRTAVILATDGGPNCNLDARCGVGKCLPNLEHFYNDQFTCDDSFNCCDPANVPGGGADCIDDTATEVALSALARSGIPSYIVGLPGSDVYSDVLSAFAVAGQTARQGPVSYYATGDQAELTAALKHIIGSVAISCDVPLDTKPPDLTRVNVYFDNRVVAYDDVNGWAWTGDQSLQIRGTRCEELESGDVAQVQVVAGCDTFVE